MTEPEYSEVRIWERIRNDPYRDPYHEPSVPVHNVFSRAIPGAFGIGFLRKLIAASKSNMGYECDYPGKLSAKSRVRSANPG